MKLTAQIKLNPTKEQCESLIATLEEFNCVCNQISGVAWDKKTFGQYKLHYLVYKSIRESSKLSSQATVRAIGKVADTYKLDKKRKRKFRKHGSATYDSRILSYNFEKQVASIWTVNKREKIPMIISEHHEKLLQFQQGESDLCYIRGKWYLFATCDVPNDQEKSFENILGVDLGIIDIASDSTGHHYSGDQVKQYREKRYKVRKSLQSKAHKGASRSTIKNTRRTLKRLSGKESRAVRLINHTISKQIVENAITNNMAIALEDLKGIRKARVRKKQRRTHHSWSFNQLRQFIQYKAERAGIPVFLIPPAYTSKTCSVCYHIGVRNGKHFKCNNCGNEMDADHNGAVNIATWGRIVNRPENSTFACSIALHCV